MRDNEITQQRDRDLFVAYKAAFGRRDVRDHSEAIRYAIAASAPRFYVSAQRASRYIRREENGGSSSRNPQKRAMVKDLYAVYLRLREKKCYRAASVSFVASFAVMERARSFYLSFDRAAVIISRMRNRGRKRNGQ